MANNISNIITCRILVLGSTGSGRTTLIETIIDENIVHVHETISGTKYDQIQCFHNHLTFIKTPTFETNGNSWHEAQEFILKDLLPIHAIWLLLHYQSDIDENLLNQLKMLPSVPSFIILNKADFLQSLFSYQSELEKDMKYFDDTNQKDFPDYFRNNQILMAKRECLMKWKMNNEDVVNLQHIFLMSLADEDDTGRPIGVKTLLEETISVVDVSEQFRNILKSETNFHGTFCIPSNTLQNEHDGNGWTTEEMRTQYFHQYNGEMVSSTDCTDIHMKTVIGDVDKLTQIGLDTTQFFQWLDKENTDCTSLFHLIPAYFEYQINTYLGYDKADFQLQLVKLGLTPACVMFIDQQTTRNENDDKSDAIYYALQYCLHQCFLIYEIPLDPPLTSTPLNQIQTFDIQVTNELLPGNFQLVKVKNYHTNMTNISLLGTGLLQEVNDVKLLFHATQVHKVAHILRYGLDPVGTRLNLDFGPGFYVNTSFKDARDWCVRRIAPYNDRQAAILIFEVPKDVYSTWHIHKLDYQTPKQQINNLTEWQYVVQSCRAGDINNRARQRYDALEGPQCFNPGQVPSEVPKIRYTREDSSRIAWQINLHSSNTQARIMDYATNVVTFTDI